MTEPTPYAAAFAAATKRRQHKLHSLGLSPWTIKDDRHMAGWAQRHVSQVLGIPRDQLFPKR